MKFIRASHVIANNDRTITFGIDVKGDVWLVTNSGSLNPDVIPEYFKLTALTFSEYIVSLVQLATSALRYKLTGNAHDPMWDSLGEYETGETETEPMNETENE